MLYIKLLCKHNHNLSVSGGTQKTKYFLSGGFMKQNGFIKGHNLQRGNFRSNIDTNPIEGMKIAFNVGARIEGPEYFGYTPLCKSI